MARVNKWSVDLVTVSSGNATCGACGHPEQAHVLEDVPHSLEKPGFCVECETAEPTASHPDAPVCDSWHEFIPAQQP